MIIYSRFLQHLFQQLRFQQEFFEKNYATSHRSVKCRKYSIPLYAEQTVWI